MKLLTKRVRRVIVSLPILLIIALGILAIYPAMLGVAITWVLFGSRADKEPRIGVVLGWNGWLPVRGSR